MCNDARKKITKMKMSIGTKEAFDVVLDEIGKTNKKIDTLVAEQHAQGERIGVLEKNNAEILALVRPIYERVIVDKIDEQAAQMGLVKKIFTTRAGWVAMALGVLGFVAIGIAVVYMIEHASGVAQIVAAAK